jgi:hypothetical protein
MMIHRTTKLRQEIKLDTQQMRIKTLNNLQELFDLAATLAKGNIKTQTEGGETQTIKLKQRQNWTRIATYIAQIINSVAKGLDERQIDEDLTKLETMINEITTKNQTQQTPATTP